VQIVFPIYERFTALDAIGPYEVLSRIPGAEVVFAAARTGPHSTDTGVLTIVAQAALDEVEHPDVVVVPGGPGVRDIMGDEALSSWVRRVHETTAWTTSVCTGALVLGAAGLLDGLDATTHWGAVEALESLGARYTAERVVQQGKIVTAAGVSSGIDMALWLTAQIMGDEVACAVQLSIEYDPQPPFDAGSVAKAGPDTVEIVRQAMAARAS